LWNRCRFFAVAEFNAVLKGDNKTPKVEMFESLAGERKWNPGGGADPAANPTQQEWVGRAVRKNFEGSVLSTTWISSCSRSFTLAAMAARKSVALTAGATHTKSHRLI
jgi:hypothetical protein